MVGAVLSPITNVFEVKLTGSLDKPEWALTLDPTNLIRSLVPGEDAAAGKAGNEGAKPAEKAGRTGSVAPVDGVAPGTASPAGGMNGPAGQGKPTPEGAAGGKGPVNSALAPKG